jgi:hypothetical protein
MLYWVTGNTIEKHSRGGGAKESHNPFSELAWEAQMLKHIHQVIPSNGVKSFLYVELEEKGWRF